MSLFRYILLAFIGITLFNAIVPMEPDPWVPSTSWAEEAQAECIISTWEDQLFNTLYRLRTLQPQLPTQKLPK